MGAPDWLDRYRNGDRSLVWHELRQLGAGVRHESDLAAEAQLVCDEMAHRARQNIDVLIERLSAEGYRFHSNDDDRAPVPPWIAANGTQQVFRWLTATFVHVPMTLVSWLRIVGDVWLVGSHPEWHDAASADPFVFEITGARYPGSYVDFLAGELDAYYVLLNGGGGAQPFVLPVAPDRLHKDNTSGGPPYGLVLPDATAEGLFVAETTMPFVDYLNLVFQHGGFPGPTGTNIAATVKARLAKDLLLL